MSWHFLSPNGYVQIGVIFLVLFALVKPLGLYVSIVYRGGRTWFTPVLGPIEALFYRACGVDAGQEMNWKEYARALLVFSFAGITLLYAILRCQEALPFNPRNLPGIPADLAFNTAVSFVTNTNWQNYAGEAAMSHFSQMAGLTVQNFLSAAAGMAVLMALVRGFARRNSATIGNFWVDLTRGALHILLPLSLLFAVLLGGQGVVQDFEAYAKFSPLEKEASQSQPEAASERLIPLGPVASQVAIKQLGTNGGGFFSTNSAHPFENPTPFSNFLELLAILLIPMALCYSFGHLVGDTRQGWSLLVAMTLIFLPLLLGLIAIEQGGNPRLGTLNVDLHPNLGESGGNMEGKETRFGIVNSAFWAVATTATSSGSVNAMHDSFLPLGGLITLLSMQLGEVVYGGCGSGLYGMLVYVVIAVFIAGLMVGRTPEYLGKKIGVFEMKMAALVILIPPLLILCGTALAVMTDAGRAGIFNPGAQGFSEVLYAFTSAGNNNGSAFAGLSANTPFYNIVLGVVMFISRFWIILPVLAMAGALAEKNAIPPSPGTLDTHTPLFIGILVAVVLLVGVLTFVPSLALGPVAEHFRLMGPG